MSLSRRVIRIVTIALIAFVLIFVCYFLTRGKVQANDEAKLNAAFENVFPDAVSFDEADYRSEYLTRFLADNGYADDQVYVNKVTFARNDVRDVQGIVVQVSSYKKYGGIITMLVGIQNDGTVNGYSILNISEAKDLDLKVKDETFAGQFRGVKADSFTLVNSEAKITGEIVPANGAEDASQTVVRAVNASILTNTFIDEYFGGVGD